MQFFARGPVGTATLLTIPQMDLGGSPEPELARASPERASRNVNNMVDLYRLPVKQKNPFPAPSRQVPWRFLSEAGQKHYMHFGMCVRARRGLPKNIFFSPVPVVPGRTWVWQVHGLMGP